MAESGIPLHLWTPFGFQPPSGLFVKRATQFPHPLHAAVAKYVIGEVELLDLDQLEPFIHPVSIPGIKVVFEGTSRRFMTVAGCAGNPAQVRAMIVRALSGRCCGDRAPWSGIERNAGCDLYPAVRIRSSGAIDLGGLHTRILGQF